MSKLDLLLVNPNTRKQVYQSLGKELAAVENPVWAGLIAAFALKQGLSVEVLDAEAEALTPDQAAAAAKDRDAVLVAVVVYGHQPSASTQNMPGARAFLEAFSLLDPSRPTLMLGGHVAALPERTLHEEPTRFVCSGEGLHTVVQLVAALKAGATDFRKVPDLLYRDGTAVVRTPSAPLVTDLDRDMPVIPWRLFPMAKYRAHNWHCFDGLKRQPYASIYTTLGCPYHCTFCCIQAPFKPGEAAAGMKESVNSYRMWSAKSVLAQLKTLVEDHGVRNVKLADELFVLNPSHVETICDGIIKNGWDLNFWAYARVDSVRDRMIDKLKKAGVNWLAFGIEAADEKVRDAVQKGYDQDDIATVVGKVRAAGIRVIGNYIFGLPEDDLGTMRKTLDLALQLNCEFANFYCTMAYPGSQLYRQAVAEGWRLPETWSGYSQHSVDTLPLPTKHLSPGQVLKFRDDAFHAYFTNPRYLEMVERTFGAPTAAHIREMTKTRLERKFAAP